MKPDRSQLEVLTLLMRSLIIAVLMSGNILAQSPLETQVLQKIGSKVQGGQTLTFSSLYNSDEFDSEEKAFLGRLYEVFFAIPGYLKSEMTASGEIPTRSRMARQFNLSPQSIHLLLTVMERDQRVPPLFTRDSSGEITSLNEPNIDAFLARRGDGVRFARWEGQPLPSFTLNTLEDASFDSTQLAGKPVLLYFWFTGCPPCVRIAPILKDLHQTYAERGVVFVGINADDLLDIGTTNLERREYLDKQGLSFVNLNLTEEVRAAFGNVNVYPTLFLVSADGKVDSHLINFQTEATLTEKVEALLAE